MIYKAKVPLQLTAGRPGQRLKVSAQRYESDGYGQTRTPLSVTSFPLCDYNTIGVELRENDLQLLRLKDEIFDKFPDFCNFAIRKTVLTDQGHYASLTKRRHLLTNCTITITDTQTSFLIWNVADNNEHIE